MATCSRDLINCLSDPLLCHILSFLSTKEAASTSLLSKRWRYLLAYVPNLEFDDSDYLHPEARVPNPLEGLPGYYGFSICIGDKTMKLSNSFPCFVYRTLALQAKYMLHKFFLKLVDEHDPVDPDCVPIWIHAALRRGVSDMHLVITLDSLSELPPRMFLSKTLVKLRICISGGDPQIDVEKVHLPKLKFLHLELVSFEDNDDGLNTVLSGCPVLEELVLENIWSCVWESFSVSVPTLKRLTCCCPSPREMHEGNPNTVSFDTPNLVCLEYTEVVGDQYPKVRFDSLVKAKIDLSKPEEEFAEDGEEVNNRVCNATDFVKGISNVQMLYLSANTLEVLTFCCKAIPIFNKLTHLTIQSEPKLGWESVPTLLKNCPNLETLVFLGLRHKATDKCGDLCLCNREENDEDVVSCLASSRVKVLKIHINGDKIEKQIKQVKHFLETMPHLEQLVLYYALSLDEDVILSSQLQMLTEVASPKCKVQLSPSSNLSSTAPS